MKIVEHDGYIEINSDGDLTITKSSQPITRERMGACNITICINGFRFLLVDEGFKQKLRVTWAAIKYIWGK